MPRGDGTGPNGTGGRCTPLWRSGQIARPLGLGFGRGLGRGFGRGFQNPYFADTTMPAMAQPTKEQELQYLEDESSLLGQQLESIKKRIEELKK